MGVSQGFPFKMEIISMTMSNSGSSAQMSGSATFANTYNNKPVVLFSHWDTTVPYVNVTLEHFENSLSTTGVSCTWTLQSPNVFGAGTAVAKFLVVGN